MNSAGHDAWLAVRDLRKGGGVRKHGDRLVLDSVLYVLRPGRQWRIAEAYFAELQASGNPASTLPSYGMDLLRWWRLLWALGITWDRAPQAEGRDFARRMQLANKPVPVRWRHRQAGREAERPPPPWPAPGTPNPVTRKVRGSLR
ncbi:hypothetical protein [Streptomyces sp. NPDC001933]|uniref:hypothetical protein n=1 Tax=Streptomyces sp. NPDC001933 TaxID=3364626 RepID=UPI0036C4BC69